MYIHVDVELCGIFQTDFVNRIITINSFFFFDFSIVI